MNRIFKRTLNKYLDITSPDEFEEIIRWIENIDSTELNDLKVSFIDGVRRFFHELEKAYGEFERVINDRENSIKINENELQRVNQKIREEADLQKKIINKFKIILENLSLKREGINSNPNFDYDGKIIDLVTKVENLVKAYDESLQDMENIFNISLIISGSKSFKDLETNLKENIKKFIGNRYETSLFLYSKDDGSWYNNSFKGFQFEHLKNQFTNQLVINDELGRPQVFVGFVNDASVDWLLSKRQEEKIKVLSPVIHITAENIKYLRQQESRLRLEHELATAKIMQSKIIPPPLVSTKHLNLYGFYESANECGGDWWSYYSLKERDVVVLGDVTGHGTASALLTTFSKGFFDAKISEENITIPEILKLLNTRIYEFGDAGMTMSCVEIDYKKRKVSFFSAGHVPPFLLNFGDEGVLGAQGIDSIITNGPVLGFKNINIKFSVNQIDLKEEQMILLYSDGLTEGVNNKGDQYSDRRLERFLRKLPSHLAGKDVMNSVINNYSDFMNGATNNDDVTAVLIEPKLRNPILQNKKIQSAS